MEPRSTPKEAAQSIEAASQAQPPQSEQSRLALEWSKHSKPASTFKRYTKTCVLMLHWEKSDWKKRLKDEVKTLHHVFKDEYSFTVEEFCIHERKRAQSQLNKAVADFVYNHEAEGALLIIYFAGHGRSEKSEFWVKGSTSQESEKNESSYQASWMDAERNLHKTCADVLLIFDCCHAGALCQPRDRGETRFEFLGACPADERTAGPGDKSFTRAMTWALKELKHGKPFTASTLRKKIKEYAKFPKDKYPVIGQPLERNRHGFVMICPMNDGAKSATTEAETETKKLQSESLDLRFHFREPISDRLFLEIIAQLNTHITDNADLCIDSISFLGKNALSETVKLKIYKLLQHVKSKRLLSGSVPVQNFDMEEAKLDMMDGGANKSPSTSSIDISSPVLSLKTDNQVWELAEPDPEPRQGALPLTPLSEAQSLPSPLPEPSQKRVADDLEAPVARKRAKRGCT